MRSNHSFFQVKESDLETNYELIKEILMAVHAMCPTTSWKQGVPHLKDFQVSWLLIIMPNVKTSIMVLAMQDLASRTKGAFVYTTCLLNYHKEFYNKRGGKTVIKETMLHFRILE